MVEITVSKFAFASYVRFCCLLALNMAVILATLFAVTNDGRQINLGPLYYKGASADWMVLAFWLVMITGLTIALSVIGYPLINFLLKFMGGLKMSGELR